MGEFTEEKINERLKTLTEYLEDLKEKTYETKTIDDFKGLELQEIENILSDYNISDAKNKSETIYTFLSIDPSIYSFFENVIEELSSDVSKIINEINNQLQRKESEKDKNISYVEKHINFYNTLKSYLFESIVISDETKEKIVNFIKDSDLTDDEKFELSLLVAKNIVKSGKHLEEESQNLDVQIEGDFEVEISDFNEELDVVYEIMRQPEKKGSQTTELFNINGEDPLILIIDSFDIDASRKNKIYDLIKRYEREYMEYFDNQIESMEFNNWFDDESVDMSDLLKQETIENSEFLMIIDTCLYILKNSTSTPEFQKITSFIDDLINKFSLDSSSYGSKMSELLEDYIEPLESLVNSKDTEFTLDEQRIRDIKNYLQTAKTEIEYYKLSDNYVIEMEKQLSDIEYELSGDRDIDEDEIEASEALSTKKIIFASDAKGDPYIKRDINKFKTEKYASIKKAFDLLMQEEKTNNPTKFGNFNSNNGHLEGIAYTKDFKIRLYYKNLPGEYVYVILLNEIKSDNDTIKRQKIEDRIKALYTISKESSPSKRNVVTEFDELEALFKRDDEEALIQQQQILEKNAIYLASIMNKLNGKKKKTKNKKEVTSEGRGAI